LLAHILEAKVELSDCILLDACRNTNSAWIGQTFQPSSNIHAITENITILNNHVANIDAHSQLNAFLGINAGIMLSHDGLNLGRTSKGIDYTGELNQQTVSCGFDDAASILSDHRVNNFGSDRP